MNFEEQHVDAPRTVCEHCGKAIFDNGWSCFEPADGSCNTEEWGPVVCYVTKGNVLHEHRPVSQGSAS
jgi:hypothetical protein